MYPILLGLLGSNIRLQIEATKPYIPKVTILKKKYANVLDLYPSGFRLV